MVAPVLWMAHATFVERESTWRRTLAAGLRISVLTLITSFWWIAGLLVQGSYGIPILRYTETYYVVANAVAGPRAAPGTRLLVLLRTGLARRRGSEPAVTLTQNVPALALSLPVAHPGLRLGTPHAVPPPRLLRPHHGDRPGHGGRVPTRGTTPAPAGAAVQGVHGVRRRTGLPLHAPRGAVDRPGAGGVPGGRRPPPSAAGDRVGTSPVAGGLIVLICLNQAALFRGQMVDPNLRARLGRARLLAAGRCTHSTQGDAEYRVYELPGTDFASYRWGNTVDPITPGLTDRDYTARELIPYGTPASADLLNDWDMPLQEGTSDPATFAPIARLLGVNQIVHRADLQYERFRTPRPRATFAELLAADGLGPPEAFGEAAPNAADPRLPLQDEVEFGTPNADCRPAPRVDLPGRGPAADAAHRAGVGADRHVGQRCRRRGAGRRRADCRPTGRSSTPPRSRTTRRDWPGRCSRARRLARGHRHQPAPGPTVGLGAGERRLHRDGRRDAAGQGPGRQPPGRVPRRRRRRLHGVRAGRATPWPAPRATATRSATRRATGPPTPSTAIPSTAWRVGAFQEVDGEYLAGAVPGARHHRPPSRCCSRSARATGG